ncbi:putative cysteine protease ATG4 [Paramyrothecium foliicola]|nr:putative cysteine protease ATG4 [Paramyrothecium foliicola]
MESAMANVDLGPYRRIVQLFWDPEPVNDRNLDQPVWCLGRSYKLTDAKRPRTANDDLKRESNNVHAMSKPALGASPPDDAIPNTTATPSVKAPDTPPDSTSSSFSSSLAYEDPGQEGGWPQAFLDDFESRFWMTYRSDFESIPRSSDPKASSALSFSMRIRSQLVDQTGFSSDSGWGCMIRSGQSLLANTLATLHFGREWRRGSNPDAERGLIKLFADDPKAPYSIHNFVRHGATACGKYPGEWFGPSATARCIQALVNAYEPSLRVYSTGDGADVYEDSFMNIAKPNGDQFHPTLILVGTRLGIDKINPVYWEALVASLQMPQSVGIAGGRPSSSHYFVGAQGAAQGAHLFYLDPHYTRKALPYHESPANYTDDEVDSCHTARLRRVHIREMDPSMLIGFLIRNEDDWVEWRRCVKHVQGKSIIHVADQDPILQGLGEGRAGAIDEVEILSDDDDNDATPDT